MKLSYAITACNEHEEIIRLVTQLLNYKGENSEIVVLLDTPKAPTEMVEYLELQANADYITLIESEFDNDFAHWKNFLNSNCKGEWIFIYKNKETIGWAGKVHERIGGFESYTAFPSDEMYCIKHPKTIQRQEKQNNYYETL